MRALVTGASGFVGAHVARLLAAEGAEVRALCRSAPPPEARVAEHVAGDVAEPGVVARAVEGCEAIFHVAAHYSYARAEAERMHAVNVTGTRNVLEAAARHDGGTVPRIVVTSSSATCGPVPGRAATEADGPPDWELDIPYKATKLEGERLALAAAREGRPVTIVNPCTVLGPGDRRPTPSGKMIADVVSGRARGYIPMAGLNVVAVEDVARGHLLALERGRAGERYILGGENLTLGEAFAIAARRAGRPAPRLRIPYPVALGAARAATAIGRLRGREPELLNLDEVRLARTPLLFSSAKAQRELGYAPRGAAETIGAAVDWFLTQG